MRKSFLTLALATVLIANISPAVLAQQTIFNVPSTDVLDRGEVYVEFDAAFKIEAQEEVRTFSSFVPRIVIGAGDGVEVGLNLTGNIQPGSDATTLVPNVKWMLIDSQRHKTSLVVGTSVFIPLRHRSYKFGTYSYAAVSKVINKTRLTAGGYVASKNVFAPGTVRGGGQFGFEQRVNERFSIAADWITGRHSSGYLTPGVIFKPTRKVTTYFSYSIGNAGASKGNQFFLFELGYNLK